MSSAGLDRTEERALVAAARAGDRKALEQLFALYEPQVFRFGMKMCRNTEDAREVLQDTLLAAVRTLGDFRGDAALGTWLYSIARNFCLRRRRRGKLAPLETATVSSTSSEGRALPDPGRPPDEELAGRRMQSALDDAIGALEPKYREVLVLRDVEGLSAAEVAEALGLSVEAVKSRLHRARKSVRDRVAPLLAADEATAPAAPGCPDVVDLFSQRLEGDIDPDLCRRMEEHLGQCPRCRTRCDVLRQTLALCRASPAEVPPDIQRSVRRALRQVLELPG